jgi:transcriptional regulator with XRE-family HTH domain
MSFDIVSTTIPDPINVLIGARIRTRRRFMAVSQKALATEIGVTFQQLAKYESAHNRVSAATLWNIARALKTPVEYFFGGLN